MHSTDLLSETDYCYLCKAKLNSESTSDHIIPNKLFLKGDNHRPQLPVHHECNNIKSKEDEWFMRQLQLRCSFNPVAEQEISKLFNKAFNEKQDAYIVGKNVRNYVLAKNIFDPITWGFELKHKSQSLYQMKTSEEQAKRFEQYVEAMCRGLYIKNVPKSNPKIKKLIQKQYASLELKGKDIDFTSLINNIISKSKNSIFGQRWDTVFYFGSRVKESFNKGYIFVQFYSQFGVLTFFE